MLCRVVTRSVPLRVAVGEAVEREVLVGGQPAARDADAHHELPELVVAALLALGGAVAVVALIDAVEFQQAVAGIVERRRGVGEIARQIAAQLAALLLDGLGLREVVDGAHRRSARQPVCGEDLARHRRRTGRRARGSKVRVQRVR